MSKQVKVNKEVAKALSDEEMTILTNIQSLLGQLMTASEAGTELEQSAQSLSTQKQEDGDKKNDDDDKKDDDKDKIDKGLETTPSESSSASDPAQERIDETQSPETEESVDEVSKAIATILRNGGVAQKKKKPENPVLKAIEGLTGVVKNLQGNQSTLSTALEKILEGTGITKQLEIVAKEKGEFIKPQSAPITNIDDIQKTLAFAMEVNKVMKGEKTGKEEIDKKLSNQQIVHKNLNSRDILSALTVEKEKRSVRV